MTWSSRFALLTLVSIGFGWVGIGPAPAEEPPPDIAACLSAVGTYLTKNGVDDAATGDFDSRSLLSFTNGGHVFFTDSGEAGSATFQPFSDGRGAWRCLSGEGGKAVFKAVVIDFTFADKDNRTQSIARLDFDLTYDEAAQALSGSGKLGFVAFDGDPMNASEVNEVANFRLTGIRVDAP